MMTNLLHGAHVANKLFSTIARLRLLLVMFLTLTVSAKVWGAYGYTGEGTFTKQNSVDGDGYYVFVLTQGALTTTCSSNYITPNATYKGSEESLSDVVSSSVFQVTNYDATDKDYYILTNNETYLYSSESGKITYSDTYTQTWKTESSKLKSTSGTIVYMGCVNSKFRPYTSSSTNATSFVCVYKLQETSAEYTITLSENGEVTTKTITSTSYQLPTELSVGSCDSKTFVGWTTTEEFTSSSTPTSSDYYEKGKTVNITENTTFYAVFATSEDGGGSGDYKLVTSLTNLKNGEAYLGSKISYSGERYYYMSTSTISSNTIGISSATLSSNVLQNPTSDGKINLVSTGITNQYYIKNTEGKFLYSNSAGSLSWSTTECAWTFSNMNATSGLAELTSSQGSGIRLRAYGTSTSAGKLKTYASNTTNYGICVFLAEATTTYSDYITTCSTEPSLCLIQKEVAY